jgi:hypothetical protein
VVDSSRFRFALQQMFTLGEVTPRRLSRTAFDQRYLLPNNFAIDEVPGSRCRPLLSVQLAEHIDCSSTFALGFRTARDTESDSGVPSVGLTTLTLSCTARAHVVTPFVARRLPRTLLDSNA